MPYEILLQCHVILFQSKAWTTSMVTSCFDLMTNRAWMNDLIATPNMKHYHSKILWSIQMNRDNILNLNVTPLIGRLLQGDGNIIVELKRAVEIRTASSTPRVNFNIFFKKKIIFYFYEVHPKNFNRNDCDYINTSVLFGMIEKLVLYNFFKYMFHRLHIDHLKLFFGYMCTHGNHKKCYPYI